ncbi:helix-turn-helix domain-containing protein [Streptomyces sp. NPDC029554]|uniref:helix-turn-helix domain-containing protein n=1 Tax=Streptomyces sp. NPDC029554 TaxID=3155126 RepID=UPI003404AC11
MPAEEALARLRASHRPCRCGEALMNLPTLPYGGISIVPAVPDEGHEEFLHLGMIVRTSAVTTREGDKVVLEPKDLVFCDPAPRDVPQFDDDCRMTVFRIARRHLGVPSSDLDRVLGATVPGRGHPGALVSDFLSALAAEARSPRALIGDRLTRSALDLVAVLVMELLEAESAQEVSRAERAGHEMLSRIRAYIDRRLTEPDLSPGSIARAHHISVRYLHKLFQNDGTTVGRWVRQRRLDSCRRELSRDRSRGITVAAVANHWGFSSPAHFSRTFRQAYGMTPSQWQALATSRAGSPVVH